MVTSPDSTPDNKPSKLNFLLEKYSRINQLNAPPLAAMIVFTNDITAISFKVNALPVLKPYHPIQTKIPPISVISKLFGCSFSTFFRDLSLLLILILILPM